MNELANITKLETMMQQLITIQMDTQSDVKGINSKVDDLGKRVDDIENNYEVTTQQRLTIKKAVNKQVYKLLGLPDKRSEWSLSDKVLMEKYSHIFHQRCYSEVSRLGHLGNPYGTTTSANFISAVKDIEAWCPTGGIESLKQEADENAVARKIAKEQGY